MSGLSGDATSPVFDRVRHDAIRRTLTIASVDPLGPDMVRITLTGPELQGFVSLAPDDHIKLFLPDGAGGIVARDMTPRQFNPASLSLAIDVALHPVGPVADWARATVPGQTISMGRPRGSRVLSGPIQSWLLMGDETALSAMGRRIEEATSGNRITMIACIPGPEGEQSFQTRADLDVIWIFRPLSRATDPEPLLSALGRQAMTDPTMIWIAAESGVARALKTYLLDVRGHPSGWIQAKGYWSAGRPGETDDLGG